MRSFSFFPFMILSVIIGLCGSYKWSSVGVGDLFIKVVLSLYTIWAIALLLGNLTPYMGNMRMF